MCRCKRQYTESRSEAPAGCTLPAAAAPERNTTTNPGVRPAYHTDTWPAVFQVLLGAGMGPWSALTLW